MDFNSPAVQGDVVLEEGSFSGEISVSCAVDHDEFAFAQVMGGVLEAVMPRFQAEMVVVNVDIRVAEEARHNGVFSVLQPS